MAKPKRKTVSFEKLHDDTGSQDKTVKEIPKKVGSNNIPQLKNKLAAIPLHYLAVIITMFQIGLVNDSYGVMLKGVLALFLLQGVYDYILLQNLYSKKTKQATNQPLLIIGSLAISVLLVVPLYLIIILFGAPFLSNTKETLALCLHLSLIVFNPILVIYKFDFNQFKLIFTQEKIYRSIFCNAVLSSSLMGLIGTWLGVIPIPLDWDRPWQQWPITLLVGGYGGSIIGAVISVLFSTLYGQ